MISFYDQPELESISPIEGSTKQSVEITVRSKIEKPFTTRNYL